MHHALLLFAALGLAIFPSAFAAGPSAGLEFEFATVGMIDAKWGKAHEDAAKDMLAMVKKLNGNTGTIVVQTWPKNPDLTEVVYTDGTGRKWGITPESLNTTGYDGLEFVTPPLKTTADLDLLDQILLKFKESKSVMRGIRSSMHITVDIRHLIHGQDFDQVVERILYVENSWAEIYRTIKPRRYGSIVNRFAVPLASDQQELLKKLAAMPKAERTYQNVRRLFLNYDALEGTLRDADGTRAVRKWKYRAANYSKLFGLQGGQPVPVFEFRVADMDYGLHVQEKVKYIRDVVTREIPRQAFEFPFGRHALTPAQTNLAVKQMLGIDDPALQNIELHDTETPLDFGGKKVSMGFEAEFRSETNPFAKASGELDKANYPFMDPYMSREGTGNTEVRSIGGEWRLGEVMEEMRLVKRKLNGSLRGFHFHMFIPKAAMPLEYEERMNGWFAYIGDTMVGWRLQNKKHFFALKTWSVGRVDPNSLEQRATLRAQDSQEYLDLELRGFMGSDYDIEMTVQKIMTGLKNPELIPPSMADYTKHFKGEIPAESFEKEMEKFAQTFHGRDLTAEEKLAIQELTEGDWFKNVLPVYRLQNAQVFDEFQRRTLRDAHQNFLKETMTVVKNKVTGKYDENPAEFEKNFRYRVKRWAESIDYYSMMQSNMLLAPTSKIGRLVKSGGSTADAFLAKMAQGNMEFEEALDRLAEEERPEFTRRALRTIGPYDVIQYYTNHDRIPDAELCAELRTLFGQPSTYHQSNILNLLKKNLLPENIEFVQGILEARFNPNFRYYDEALQFLTDFEDARTVAIFKKLTTAPWKDLRSTWATEIGKRSDAATFAIIKSTLGSSDIDLQKSGLAAIEGRNDAGAMDLIRPFLSERRTELKTAAVRALGFKTDPEALTFITRYLNGRDANLKQAAMHALGNAKAPGAVDMIMTLALANPDDYYYGQLIRTNPSKEWIGKAVTYYRARSTPPAIKQILVESMGKLGDAESLALLKQLSNTPNGVYTNSAMNALFERDEPAAKVILRAYARNRRYSDYHYAISSALGEDEVVVGAEETTRVSTRRPRATTVEDYVRQNGTLRNVPCNLLLR